MQQLDRALDYLDQFFDQPLKPMSLNKAIRFLPNDTSPGYPYVKQGFKTKGEIKDRLVNDVHKLKRTPIRQVFDQPCLAGLRLALSKKPKNKPRLVWVYPASIATAEAMFYGPIMSRLFKSLIFSWDFSFLRGEVIEPIHWLQQCSTRYGTDVSSFDATVQIALIQRVFTWFRSKFAMTYEDHKLFTNVMHYFINTPLWIGDSIYLKRQGVPSGSFFTQVVDSIVNFAYQNYISVFFRGDIPVTERYTFIRLLGDDSLIGMSEYVEKEVFERAVEDLRESTGVQIHETKGFFCNVYNWAKTDFLGFSISLAGPPYCVKDTYLVEAQCLFPEVPERDVSISMARLVGIKWCAGDDQRCLDVVNYYWELLKERYPDINPSSFPKEYSLLFRYVFGRWVPDPERFPEDSEVIKRYRRVSSSFETVLYSTSCYWKYLSRKWDVIDLDYLSDRERGSLTTI